MIKIPISDFIQSAIEEAKRRGYEVLAIQLTDKQLVQLRAEHDKTELPLFNGTELYGIYGHTLHVTHGEFVDCVYIEARKAAKMPVQLFFKLNHDSVAEFVSEIPLDTNSVS